MRLETTRAGARPRYWTTCAAAMLAAACLDGENRTDTVDSAEPRTDFGADPAHLRAGPPRVRLGGASGEGQTDFHDIAGVVVDRAADALIVANRGDATLRTFALDGAWRDTRGGAGGGPRELGELTALFGYRGDSVVVFDDERGDVSVWSYAGGEVRRVRIPILPGDTLQSPRLQGSMVDGRLVWAVERPDRSVDEIGESHPLQIVIFLTSAEGTGFDPVAETTGIRVFRYPGDSYISGRIAFSPQPFVLPRDSVLLYGSTGRPRAERVTPGGMPLAPIEFSLPSIPVTAEDREVALAPLRAEMNRLLPAQLRTRMTATLDVWAVPDSFPPLGSVVAGDDGRVWVTGYRPRTDAARGGEEATIWSVYAGPGSPARDVEFPGGFDLLWADETEAVGVVRDELDIEHILIVPLPAGARAPGR
ncbi:hypothetical protein [Candidatus Palauibacter soopunensis]|uniref:hypothetical protein n=1 Tax=Candidatus Palauibacter soopunensis TaxID=3056739 RepID=UPI0023A420A4|nr:hypothetical protein [Candidatus Palauibacter soopunensis]MDE2878697.1 hypothetical protein [Candidatus Palauibacter soopunensis]